MQKLSTNTSFFVTFLSYLAEVTFYDIGPALCPPNAALPVPSTTIVPPQNKAVTTTDTAMLATTFASPQDEAVTTFPQDTDIPPGH